MDKRVRRVADLLRIPHPTRTEVHLLRSVIDHYTTGEGLSWEQWDPTFNAMEEVVEMLQYIEEQVPHRRRRLKQSLERNAAFEFANWLSKQGSYRGT